MDQIVCGIRRHCDAGFFRTPSAEMEQKNMEQYATQMGAARKGIVTEELKKVAAKERMTTEELMPLVAEGKVVICANRHHKCIDPEGVGSMLRTKINVNLGISRDCKDYDVEMEKVMAAVDMGAHAIMDLSSHGNTIPFRRKLTAECPAMIGTVPVYDSVIHYQRDLATLTAKDFIDVVRLHAEDGVDFVTLHCGITRKTIEQIRKHKRKMNIVSRGGSLVFAWMCMTGEENPFYEYYDEILEICREHDVTISLAPRTPLAMSAACAAIFDAMIPCLTSSTFGSASGKTTLQYKSGMWYNKKGFCQQENEWEKFIWLTVRM